MLVVELAAGRAIVAGVGRSLAARHETRSGFRRVDPTTLNAVSPMFECDAGRIAE